MEKYKKSLGLVSTSFVIYIIGLFLIDILSIIGLVGIVVGLFQLKGSTKNSKKTAIFAIINLALCLASFIYGKFMIVPDFDELAAIDESQLSNLDNILDILHLLPEIGLEYYTYAYIQTLVRGLFAVSSSLFVMQFIKYCKEYDREYIRQYDEMCDSTFKKGKFISVAFPIAEIFSGLLSIVAYNLVNIARTATDVETLLSQASSSLVVIMFIGLADSVFVIWWLIELIKVRRIVRTLSITLPIKEDPNVVDTDNFISKDEF